MRPEGLREQTRTQAQNASGKLKTRLSKGEKTNRKRMAEIVTVYELTPEPRTAADILPDPDTPAPAARTTEGAEQVAEGQRHRRRQDGHRRHVQRG